MRNTWVLVIYVFDTIFLRLMALKIEPNRPRPGAVNRPNYAGNRAGRPIFRGFCIVLFAIFRPSKPISGFLHSLAPPFH